MSGLMIGIAPSPPENNIVNVKHNETSRLSEISQSDTDSKESEQYQDDFKSSASNSDHARSEPDVVLPQTKIAIVDEISSHSSSTAGGKLSGNWGWFEDVHAPDGKQGEDSSNNSKDRKSKSKGKTNNGLFEFDHSFQKSLDPIVSSNPEAESSAMAVTAPVYVLEESRSSQKLWKESAGNRPPQPVEERAFFEKMWAANFSNSQVMYSIPMEVLTASSPFFLSPFADRSFQENTNDDCTNYNLAAPFNTHGTTRIGAGGNTRNDGGTENVVAVKEAEADAAEATLIHGLLVSTGALKCNNSSVKSMGPPHHYHTLVNEKIKGSGISDLTVLVRGDNVFGTTVSKSFIKKSSKRSKARPETVSVSISIGSYRVVESKKHGKYAQFLVIYCEGSFRETVGVWKRHSDFDKLSQKVLMGSDHCSPFHPFAIEEEHDHEILPNAVTSWRLLQKRQRWYRCLDAGYLSLKIFLLERFLHDILFESSSSQILRDFVGVDNLK